MPSLTVKLLPQIVKAHVCRVTIVLIFPGCGRIEHLEAFVLLFVPLLWGTGGSDLSATTAQEKRRRLKLCLVKGIVLHPEFTAWNRPAICTDGFLNSGEHLMASYMGMCELIQKQNTRCYCTGEPACTFEVVKGGVKQQMRYYSSQ